MTDAEQTINKIKISVLIQVGDSLLRNLFFELLGRDAVMHFKLLDKVGGAIVTYPKRNVGY